MAASPVWKVYLGREYRAACKYVEDAAAVVALLGNGATLRYEHDLVLWREGEESQSAAESYDHVGEVANARLTEHREKMLARRAASQASYSKRMTNV